MQLRQGDDGLERGSGARHRSAYRRVHHADGNRLSFNGAAIALSEGPKGQKINDDHSDRDGQR